MSLSLVTGSRPYGSCQASHPTGTWLARFTTKCNSDGVAQSHCLLPTPSRKAALVIHSRTMTV
jgi:hypothetical protein